MIKVRVRLTPVGHYFLGGERGFGYDKKLNRQMSDSYYISSLKVPSQTTLFGAIRYIFGVKDEVLRSDAAEVIGSNTYNITDNNNSFGMINGISPVYLLNEKAGKDTYYVRTPFDHRIAKYVKAGDTEKRTVNTHYTPFKLDSKQTTAINYPGTVVNKVYPLDFKAKDGIAKSYTSLTDSCMVEESDIFDTSVEVVSRKVKNTDDSDKGFAKKEYVRLKKGWSFAVFTELECNSIPDYNKSVVMGKDSSVFSVEIAAVEEPDVQKLFKDRESNFHYCQSAVYVSGNVNEVIDKSKFSIIESESLRVFKTQNAKLSPEYDTPLLQLLSAGSIIYTDDIGNLRNDHAMIAGFNYIIDGGIKG